VYRVVPVRTTCRPCDNNQSTRWIVQSAAASSAYEGNQREILFGDLSRAHAVARHRNGDCDPLKCPVIHERTEVAG
jgi:hypothetical protein